MKNVLLGNGISSLTAARCICQRSDHKIAVVSYEAEKESRPSQVASRKS